MWRNLAYPDWHTYSSVTLVCTKWYFIVVFICIFFMTKDVDHHFVCLSAICTSLKKMFLKSFADLWLSLSCSCWGLRVPYVFCIQVLSDRWFANIFSHSVGHLFTLFIILLAAQNFQFWWSPIYKFFLCTLAFGVFSENTLPNSLCSFVVL